MSFLKLEFQTSERSRRKNWVLEVLKTQFPIAEFEGFTVKEEKVTLLLDRALLKEKNPLSPDEIVKFLKVYFGNAFQLKQAFAKQIKVPWYFVIYQKNPEYVWVFDILEVRLIREFDNYISFAEWTRCFRDLKMLSSYQESGLPEFDKILRWHGIPWPGNLDGIIGHPQNLEPFAIIEFQFTSKASVREHCSNKWFLPRGRRKGDEQRWKVMDIIRRQADLPLWIFVWSQNQEEGVKVKVVKDIIYSNDPQKRRPGLVYEFKQIMSGEELLSWVSKQSEVSGST